MPEHEEWVPAAVALATWSVPELVAFHMAASETLTLCDDGHAPSVEPAGLCIRGGQI